MYLEFLKSQKIKDAILKRSFLLNQNSYRYNNNSNKLKQKNYSLVGFGRSQILLCAAIAAIPAKVIPIVSAKLVVAMENCLSSSDTFQNAHMVKAAMLYFQKLPLMISGRMY